MDCEIEQNYQQLNGSARACSDNLNPHAQREITNFAGGSVSTQFSPNNFMCSFYCSFDIRTIWKCYCRMKANVMLKKRIQIHPINVT